MTGISEGESRLPAPRLRPYVRSYDGYRLYGFAPGRHIGMPSTSLTVILTIDEPIHIERTAHPGQAPGRWTTLASGLTDVPCTIAHDGDQHGIQLALTPLGSRALLGVPTAALGAWMVDLEDVVGHDADELHHRIGVLDSWSARFDVLDEVLLRRIDALADDARMAAPLARAWQLLTDPSGQARVADVADETGWSRRHLITRFSAEFGITPKDAARISRFSRSHRMMRHVELPRIADIAAVCGYYDQAHMARDWRDLAGMSPSRWRAEEKFAFVQDDEAAELAHSHS